MQTEIGNKLQVFGRCRGKAEARVYLIGLFLEKQCCDRVCRH